ncbi:MAG: tyrosine-type recombinase/integrase [Candidatus Rokubacteria bacterium]|nr:tyrosine-type recombinase/integrase [Candidatus Rokubacteria bacterium]
MRPISPPQPTPGEDWPEEFLRALARADLSAKTISGYKNDISLFGRWYQETLGAQFAPGLLIATDLINYREWLIGARGVKGATANRHLDALGRLARWAREHGLLKEDPAPDVKRVQLGGRRKRHGLADAEVHGLLRSAGLSTHGHATRNLALVQVLVHTGIRVAEAAALKIGDVQARDRSGFVRIRRGKGLKERELPLNTSARRALRKYLDARGQPPATAPVFESGRGTPMSVRTIQQVIAGLVRRAKIDRISVSVHSLRHTFALNFLRDHPGKLVDLQMLLGHESLDTTAVYVCPSDEDLAAAVEHTHLNVY